MSQSEELKIDPNSIDGVLKFADEVMKEIVLRSMAIESMKRSHRAKEAWKRRREREYRATHNEAFIYVRSSSADVLELQASVLKLKATDLGLTCRQVFYDSCSGMTLPSSRTGFGTMIAALRDTPTVSKLVVWDEAQLSRSRYDLSSIKRRLKDFGVQLVFVEE